ncbi:type II toxin-antitoxin system YafQ family toxin [Fenollaria timonensis]|uniref:type II toxin-antitoxin system YafQ family toxin n=1 Tax=Fenollaria timonensis TaxID=1723384 RepID=UPI00071CD1AA|nr:type II toxin-antitoxin system YafQ family toxin [Fenollaria timonensis]
MKYQVLLTSKFKKDFKLLKKQGKNTDKILAVINKLARGESLDAKYKDHPLLGDYLGARECHIEPDLLLIYEKQENILILNILRAGSHSNLF